MSSPNLYKKRKKWNSEQMTAAIFAVREKKMGFLKASKHYQVPRTTLFRLVTDVCQDPNILTKKKIGRKPLFNESMEQQLVEYILTMEEKFYGLTQVDVRRLAYQLAVKNGIQNPFKHEIAGRYWLKGFLKRNKRLSSRTPTGTSYARALGFTRERVNLFYDILEKIQAEHPYPADRIFNVDESGLSVVQSKIPKVLGLRGKRQIGALTSAERGSLITIVVCMSASGIFIPPMMIFPRKNMNLQLMKGAPVGSFGVAHPSGWIQSNLFTKWFEHFIQKTSPCQASPVLLILDGHFSHTKNVEVIDLAKKNYVTIVSLPPHCTHKMQPLDKTFMGPLKTYYSEEIRMWLRQNSRPITAFDIAELFGNAYRKCQTGEIAANGFKVTGIWPMNRHIFTEADFIAAAKSAIAPPCQPHDIVQTANQPNPSGPTANQLNTITEPASLIMEVGENTETPSPSHPQEPEPSTSRGNSSIITPFEISPVPKIRKRTSNRGRKAAASAVITSSPYKNDLIESQAKKRLINNPKNKGLKRARPIVADSSDSETNVSSGSSEPDYPVGTDEGVNDDATCMFCERKFSEDRRGELWVQCLMCRLWAHTDCAGCETDSYVCDFCKI